jgi:hypothetical protein
MEIWLLLYQMHVLIIGKFDGKLLRYIAILIVYMFYGLWAECYEEYLQLCIKGCIKVSAKEMNELIERCNKNKIDLWAYKTLKI